MRTSLFRTSLSAVFHRASSSRSEECCSTDAASRGINCRVFRMIQIDLYTQVSFALLPARLRVGSDILSRLVCLACNYASTRVPHRAYSSAAQSINPACHWLFFHRGDISISCLGAPRHASAWMKTSRFAERSNSTGFSRPGSAGVA